MRASYRLNDGAGSGKAISEIRTVANMATDFGKRLVQARAHAGLSQEELARRVGMAQSTLATAESRGFGSRKTAQIAVECGVNAHWLATGEGDMLGGTQGVTQPGISTASLGVVGQQLHSVSNADLVPIRRVRFKLCAGASGFGVDDVDNEELPPIFFRRKWLESRGFSPSKLFAARVCNGSMEPGLYDGDTVVVNAADTSPKDGAVFAFNYEGELVIKRLVRDAGQWWLVSDNPNQAAYPRKVCGDNIFIVGKIVHKQSEHV